MHTGLFSQNLVIQLLKAFMKSKLYIRLPEEKSQWHVDRLCQSTAISLKDMNDLNESYVAVLFLGCMRRCTKICSLLVQCVLIQMSWESSFLFLKYSLNLSLRLQIAWCCQVVDVLVWLVLYRKNCQCWRFFEN